jgi:galactofuranose transport system permease protein
VCALLYASAAVAYDGFASPAVFLNFFTDNAVLGIAAIGLTFVILSGGIDLSVGAVIGLTSLIIATALQKTSVHPIWIFVLALGCGTAFGAGMGALIQYFALPPFLVTLAGMFLARGLAFMIRLESVAIENPFYSRMADAHLPLGASYQLPLTAIILLLVFGLAVGVSWLTRFGRNIYAIGGNEQSALLMGLPVGQTKIAVYATSGFCSALAGVVYTLYTFSGNPTAGTGLELDAIAAVVIGGTLLSGGVGYVAGTLVGVLIFGIIQTAITFQGTLSSWWTKIVIGVLLLIFILLQKIIQTKRIASR